ncbi:hypothetical protein P389DRAFT_211331 [Cystobasidium minutum MCA 4210]|uniref:uncharacterized protein n=1 Tax=Cystobasidium minutum MCA 4210 TaxID=1397322 RepID=UPI0034CD2C61|eukprot:jgi/Rhomi1/211331/estExt_Genemark1.C_4_t20496
MNTSEAHPCRTSTPTSTGTASSRGTHMHQHTPRISIECEDGIEHILLQEQETKDYNKNQHRISTSSSSTARDSSSMEGHAGSDAFTILLQRKEGTTTTTRGRSQSDSIVGSLAPSWCHTPPPSNNRQLPPPPKSFSTSCKRTAPIPALILHTSTSPSKQQQSTAHMQSDFITPTNLAPVTPITALSVAEGGSSPSPGILTPSLIQLRKSFPLPPSLASINHNLQRAVLSEDNKDCASFAMLDQDEIAFTSYKLPGAFTSLDSLETVVQSQTLERDGELKTQQQVELVTPHTPIVATTPQRNPSNIFSSPGSCSSSASLYSSPQSQGQHAKEQQGTNKGKSKRTSLKQKRSKASLRSNASSKHKDDEYLNDWISQDFRSSPGQIKSGPTQINASPSPSTRRIASRDRESTSNSATAATARSASRSSWRTRYLTVSRLEARPETSMSTYTTMTHYTYATTNETVYEDARDYQSGDEADVEEEEVHADAERDPASASYTDFPPAFSSQKTIPSATLALSSSSSSVSTITALTSNTVTERRNSSRFRPSFQRRRVGGGGATSPLLETRFRPDSSLSVLSNRSTSATITADLARRGSITPRSSPECTQFIANAYNHGTLSSSSSAFQNHRLSHVGGTLRDDKGANKHRRTESSSSGCSSSSFEHVTMNTNLPEKTEKRL